VTLDLHGFRPEIVDKVMRLLTALENEFGLFE